jgi:hypothetical protein
VGFSDRFKEAAEAARTSLQDRGIGTAGTIRGVRSLERTDHDLAAADRARSLGAPDPYALVTHDEVVALTGLPVGGPYLTWTDDDIGVRYVAEDGRGRLWSFGVHAGHSTSMTSRFDPGGWYRWMVAMLDGAETVPNLGRAAVYLDGLLYVLGTTYAYYVHVEAPEGSPVRRWASAIARRVDDRFAGGLVG